MRKLDHVEIHLLGLILDAGGSVCPGLNANMPSNANKVLRKLVNRGDLTVEETDDGPRFTLTAQGRADASP
jgi:hypothetical protein